MTDNTVELNIDNWDDHLTRDYACSLVADLVNNEDYECVERVDVRVSLLRDWVKRQGDYECGDVLAAMVLTECLQMSRGE